MRWHKVKELSTIYDDMGDVLEYGNITDDEAVALCNDMIHKSISENNNKILEAMYHAILIGVINRNIGDKLDTNSIVANMDNFNEEILEYM